MDITSVIIGLVSVALFVVPILYIQGKQKKARETLLKGFSRLAEQQQLVISEQDYWNHRFVIGIDTSQGKLLFLKKEAAKDHVVLINLPDVEACTAVNVNRDVNSNRVIDLIGLRFRFRGPKHPEQTLEFYNKEESLTLNEELVLSEKWKSIVTANLQAARQQTTPVPN